MRETFTLTIAVVLASCASTKISVDEVGDLPDEQQGFICGSLVYDQHNTNYVPLSLRDMPTSNGVSLDYKYEIKYGLEDDTAFDLFNPLLFAGMPKSQDNIYVAGRLWIRTSDGFERRYEESFVMSKAKTLFSEGETLTDIRRKGLILLRNKIDAQLIADKDLLSRKELHCGNQLGREPL